MTGFATALTGDPRLALTLAVHAIGRNIRLWFFGLLFRSPEWRRTVRSVRRDGYSILPGYLTPQEVDFLRGVCDRSANGIDSLDGDPYFVAQAPGSLRLRHMERRHPEMDYFRRQNKVALLSACLDGTFHWPSVQYSATYDGKTNPRYVAGRADNPFGGKCHVDRWHHQLKAIFLLDDVTPANGPLMLYPGTWKTQWSGFDVYRLKKWNKEHDSPPSGALAELPDDNFPAEVCAEIEQSTTPVPVTGNAGDLVLFDTRTLHFAGKIEAGQRRLLWFYF